MKAGFSLYLGRLPFAVVALAVLSTAPCAMAEDMPERPRNDWEITLGMGVEYAPSYLGANSYEMTAVPVVSIDYKDTFFASTEDGIGWNAYNQDGWKLGPIARYLDSRDEDDKDAFHIAGRRTQDLRGLGTVNGTIELGWFVEYETGSWDSTVEVRKGVNGHEGLVADFSTEYSHDVHSSFYEGNPPLILTVGPRATVVDGTFNQSFFGVTPAQSAGSGLPQYSPDGGLLSYGLNTSLTVPLSESVATTLVANYAHLAGDAADAPLVQERGSENQTMVGLFVTYNFGFN